MTYRLRDAEPALRLLITCFLTVLTAGYVVGLVFVGHTTSYTPEGVRGQFLGSGPDQPADEITYAKSAGEMYTLIHNHVLSLGMIFLIVGALLHGTSVFSRRLTTLLMIEPFAAIVTTFGGIALVRTVSPLWSWLVIASGVSLAAAYVLGLYAILAEMWSRTRGSGGA
ncbi:MAG: hypothetical protein AB1428_12550 [Bacteroidota bacterium]